jgi:pyridoxamine 5'-phosphate oxidase
MGKAIETTIAELRREYLLQSLSEDSIADDPFEQFNKWFHEAIAAQILHPEAMTLATTTPEGTPDARTVLLKGMSSEGLRFYTNYLSHKGRQLDINYSAALLFFWPDLERQVRIKGSVQKVSAADSDAYFASRPIGAQLASSISPQSEVVESRAWLERELERASFAHKDKPVARPPHWGGYVLSPHEFEFWQGRENRMSDRLRYRKNEKGEWSLARLAP